MKKLLPLILGITFMVFGGCEKKLTAHIEPRWPTVQMFVSDGEHGEFGGSFGKGISQLDKDPNARIVLCEVIFNPIRPVSQPMEKIGELKLEWMGTYEDSDYYRITKCNGLPLYSIGQNIEFKGKDLLVGTIVSRDRPHYIWLSSDPNAQIKNPPK